jgi:hypothetical protein
VITIQGVAHEVAEIESHVLRDGTPYFLASCLCGWQGVQHFDPEREECAYTQVVTRVLAHVPPPELR